MVDDAVKGEKVDATYTCINPSSPTNTPCPEHTLSPTQFGLRDLPGSYASYDRHAFLIDFNSDKEKTESTLEHVRKNRWLDNFTRALALRITVYSV